MSKLSQQMTLYVCFPWFHAEVPAQKKEAKLWCILFLNRYAPHSCSSTDVKARKLTAWSANKSNVMNQLYTPQIRPAIRQKP